MKDYRFHLLTVYVQLCANIYVFHPTMNSFFNHTYNVVLFIVSPRKLSKKFLKARKMVEVFHLITIQPNLRKISTATIDNVSP